MKSYDDNGYRYVERIVQGAFPGAVWHTKITLIKTEDFGCPDIISIVQQDGEDYDRINISLASLQEMLKELEVLH